MQKVKVSRYVTGKRLVFVSVFNCELNSVLTIQSHLHMYSDDWLIRAPIIRKFS